MIVGPPKPNEGLPKNNPEVRGVNVLNYVECFTDFSQKSCVSKKANTGIGKLFSSAWRVPHWLLILLMSFTDVTDS